MHLTVRVGLKVKYVTKDSNNKKNRFRVYVKSEMIFTIDNNAKQSALKKTEQEVE